MNSQAEITGLRNNVTDSDVQIENSGAIQISQLQTQLQNLTENSEVLFIFIQVFVFIV